MCSTYKMDPLNFFEQTRCEVPKTWTHKMFLIKALVVLKWSHKIFSCKPICGSSKVEPHNVFEQTRLCYPDGSMKRIQANPFVVTWKWTHQMFLRTKSVVVLAPIKCFWRNQIVRTNRTPQNAFARTKLFVVAKVPHKLFVGTQFDPVNVFGKYFVVTDPQNAFRAANHHKTL